MASNHQHPNEARGPERAPAARSRVLTLATAGVLLSGLVLQAAFAGSKNPGILQQYGGNPPPGGGDGGGGLSASEKAGIAVGGAAVVVGGLWYFGVIGRRKKHHHANPPPVALGDSKDGPLVRLLPAREELAPGASCAFDLQVRDKDGNWQSVTASDDASIEVQGESRSVVPQKGTRNVFCVPITAGARASDEPVTLVGTYAPTGIPPLKAEVKLRVGPATP